MSRIHLTIDRLVLHGLDPAAHQAFIASLKSGLEAILADPAARASWARPHRTPVLRLGRMMLEPGPTGAGKLGGQVASGIGRGLKP